MNIKRFLGFSIFTILALFSSVVSISEAYVYKTKAAQATISQVKNLVIAATSTIPFKQEPAPKLDKSLFYAGDNYEMLKDKTLNSSVYLAAGDINIAGKINGDANLIGGNVTVVSDIGGDLNVTGANVNISSNVNGDLKVIAGRVFVNGNIKGDLVVMGGEVFVADGVKVGGEKRVYSKSDFKGKDEVSSNLPILEKAVSIASIVGFLVMSLWGMLVTAALYFFFRGASTYVAMQASDKVSKNFISGLIIFFVSPFVILILAISGVGAYLSFILGLLYLCLTLIAGSITSITFGAIVSRYITKRNPSVNWSSVLIGCLLVIVLGLIPVFGLLVKSTVFFATFGVLVRYLYNTIRA